MNVPWHLACMNFPECNPGNMQGNIAADCSPATMASLQGNCKDANVMSLEERAWEANEGGLRNQKDLIRITIFITSSPIIPLQRSPSFYSKALSRPDNHALHT